MNLSHPINLINILNLRTEFDSITRNYKIPEEHKNSDIHSLIWFINNSRSSNRLRPSYDRAMDIAKYIICEFEEGVNNETVDLPGICR